MKDEASKEMLLKMIVKCRKSRKHKPKKVAIPALEIGGVASSLFADSEIANKSKSRAETDEVRKALVRN